MKLFLVTESLLPGLGKPELEETGLVASAESKGCYNSRGGSDFSAMAQSSNFVVNESESAKLGDFSKATELGASIEAITKVNPDCQE